MVLTEVSTIGMVHTLGLTARHVNNSAELVVIAVEGLLGLLSYRLSFHVISAVVRQLVQLITTTTTTTTTTSSPPSFYYSASSGNSGVSNGVGIDPISEVGADGWSVGPTLTSIVLDSVVTSFEREFTALASLVVAGSPSETGSSNVDSLVFYSAEFLAGLSEGLVFLSESLLHNMERGGSSILKAVKNRLSDLFIRLTFLAYSSSSGSAADPMISIELVEALALLLHPLSIMFEMDSILTVRMQVDGNGRSRKDSHEDSSVSSLELQLTRHVWFTLLMFRIKEQTRWGHYGNW